MAAQSRPGACMTSRRRWMLACAAAWIAPQAKAQASRPALRHVGVLAPSTAAKEAVTLKPFFDRMAGLGWVEGRTVRYDRAFADDRQEALPGLAKALVERGPELIYAPPATAAIAASRATQRIPIVFASVTDPVGAGLAQSLARPGGNVTGISNYGETLAPKRFELLREVLPGARRLGFMGDPTDPTTRADLAALAPVVAAQGAVLVPVHPKNPDELPGALAVLDGQRIDALITTTSLMFNLREEILAHATKRRWPVFGHRPPMAEAGAILAYAASLAEQLRRSAEVVDKVLKGARPGDVPIEQPSVFELIVNRRSAKALGIAIPDIVLMRADRVIE
ncbi:MAG: ABC transporter substrate-binding protein [Burkholderiales bacterium]|nr:ABC transporter substrate-binding protein [Burkholderiales bacterium]